MPHFLGNVVDVAYRQFLALHELVHNAHDVATNQKHGLPGRRIETGVHLNGSQQLSERNNLSRSINPDILLTAGQAKAIRIVSCILAGTSLLATMLAFYWFSRMRRRFRHNLIMGLILGDLSRSFWLCIFGIIDLALASDHKITTNSSFCQASGFFVQLGLEQADFAVLFIAIHTALQIFRPDISRVGYGVQETGLFRYRHAIYIVFAVVPPFMCSLAFVAGRQGYIAQGAFCTLPIRPFWYRLAISWIPRYVIMITVGGLYLAIYIHVALQFRSISWLRHLNGSQKTGRSSLTMPNTYCDGMDEAEFSRQFSLRPWPTADAPSIQSQSPSKRPRQISESRSRKISTGTTLVGRPSNAGTPASRSLVGESSTDDDRGPENTGDSGGDFPKNLSQPKQPEGDLQLSNDVQATRQRTMADPPADYLNRGVMRDEMNERDKIRHQTIQSQIRRMFVYPIVYFFVWSVPFIYHCMNYTKHYSQHPVFPLVLMAFATLSFMGLLDCVLFSLREKPWQHIPGSDDTFLGSFQFWKHARNRRASSNSTFALSERTASDTGQAGTSQSRPLYTFAQVLETNGTASTVHSEPTANQSAQSAARAEGLEAWDYSNGVNTRQRSEPQSDWFDRRLSMAVGRVRED